MTAEDDAQLSCGDCFDVSHDEMTDRTVCDRHEAYETVPQDSDPADAVRWHPVPPQTVSQSLEAMLEAYSETLVNDPKLLVQVALARKLATQVDMEYDGTKLAALVVRLRVVVEALGVATPEDDAFDEIAKRRREHEQRVRDQRTG